MDFYFFIFFAVFALALVIASRFFTPLAIVGGVIWLWLGLEMLVNGETITITYYFVNNGSVISQTHQIVPSYFASHDVIRLILIMLGVVGIFMGTPTFRGRRTRKEAEFKLG